MEDRELAVVVSNDNKNVSVYETIDAIKEAGFKNVFIQWYDKDWDVSQEEQLAYVRKNNLNIIFAHLGYQNINDLWLEGENGDKLVERYIKDIKECKDNGIYLVIMHLTAKKEDPDYNELGIDRLRRIIDFAKSVGVKIAFENTKVQGYLEYVLDNIDSDNIGICFDSGHYHCHFKDIFNFPKFNNRILAVHLHDNMGEWDEHLNPFDGTLDWDKVVTNLKDCNYKGPVTLELCYRNDYLNISVKEFYKKGYEVGKELVKRFKN